MRYFFGKSSNYLADSNLTVSKITNTKRIYFRSITLFRDYIPYWYNRILRNMNLVNLEASKMPSVLFFTNFANFNLGTKELDYRYQHRVYDYGSGDGYKINKKKIKLILVILTSATQNFQSV